MFWNKKNKQDQHQPTSDAILEKLKTVKTLDEKSDIVSAGLVSDIFIKDGSVIFSLTVAAEDAEKMEPVRLAAEQTVKDMPEVTKVMVALTAERKPSDKKPAPPSVAGKPRPKPQQASGGKLNVNGVKHIIAVSSAKGGVGKSTTAVNLALGLQAAGLKVGILDADIYGPSLPRLLGINEKPQTIEGTKILKPLEGHGLKAMSIGFLVEESTAMIWRGPMVVSALTQMLRDVAWDFGGDLDCLVVDMPPGTGDIQLTMAQNVPLSGAVIVSTPQDLALLDARKGISMFNKVNIPILGIIENMSYFLCPSCGDRHDVFGHGGAKDVAEQIDVPFLGGVPLHMDIRENSDAGTPVTASQPDSPHAEIYRDLAKATLSHLEGAQREAPKIVFD